MVVRPAAARKEPKGQAPIKVGSVANEGQAVEAGALPTVGDNP
jgi:hypothetical protein